MLTEGRVLSPIQVVLCLLHMRRDSKCLSVGRKTQITENTLRIKKNCPLQVRSSLQGHICLVLELFYSGKGWRSLAEHRVKMREEGDVVAECPALPGPQHEDCGVWVAAAKASGHIVKMWCGHFAATL